jgi:hypothetical protein
MSRIEDQDIRKYFAWGLSLKIFGAIVLGLIYNYYYHGGDTFGYYIGGRGFTKYLFSDPAGAISFLFKDGEADVSVLRTHAMAWDYQYLYKITSHPELLMAKITGLVNVVGLNTYLSTAVLFAWMSFLGAWKLFSVFRELAPGTVKNHALAALFIPSVIFWGSGILKDTVTMTAVCYLTFHAWQVMGHRRKIVGNSLIVIVCVYLIATIKGYILLAFAPAFIFFVINQYKYRLKSGFARAVVTPAFVGLGVILAFVFVNQIGSSLGKYSIENLESVAVGTQRWHEHQSTGRAGSGYTLGNDPDGGQLLSQFLPAVNVGLFRPYIWEAREPLQLISSLEALALLALSFYGFFKAGVKGWFRLFAKHPFLQFCLIFALIFAFAVGFTSYNFGALVRYRIPCLPFYTMFVLSMIAIAKESRRQKAAYEMEGVFDSTLLKTSR